MKREVQSELKLDDEAVYEELIPKLYKPAKRTKVVEVLAQELPFEVESAPEPEPAPVVEVEKKEKEVRPLRFLDRAKICLMFSFSSSKS